MERLPHLLLSCRRGKAVERPLTVVRAIGAAIFSCHAAEVLRAVPEASERPAATIPAQVPQPNQWGVLSLLRDLLARPLAASEVEDSFSSTLW
jgi:hypothetical protein